MQLLEPFTARIEDLDWHRRPQHGYHCSGTSPIAHLGKVKASNGTIQYKAYCPECGCVGTNFKHSELDYLDVDKIPFIRVHDVVPCERCGSEDGSELHHWAPQYLFDDADEWPTSYLCRDCHGEWHSKVTPKMSSSLKAA